MSSTTLSTAANRKRQKSEGSRSKARLDRQDVEMILSWLEKKANYISIYGAQYTSAVQPLPSSNKAYGALAKVINRQNRNRLNLDGKAVKERFERHRKLYNTWKEESLKPEFGITEGDKARGIFDIESKLERNCMCFDRMDRLFTGAAESGLVDSVNTLESGEPSGRGQTYLDHPNPFDTYNISGSEDSDVEESGPSNSKGFQLQRSITPTAAIPESKEAEYIDLDFEDTQHTHSELENIKVRKRQLGIEDSRLEIEIKKVKGEHRVEMRRLDIEERMQDKKIKLEERKILLEEKKAQSQIEIQRLQFFQTCISKGISLEEVKTLSEYIRDMSY